MEKCGVLIGKTNDELNDVTLCKEKELRELVEKYSQQHIFGHWDKLSKEQKAYLLNQISKIDFELMKRLTEIWIFNTPKPEVFNQIIPIPVISLNSSEDSREKEAYDCGEETLKLSEVGLFMVAGGQGTRLGFDKPKGTFPIGPVTKKSLFQYHAEKIINIQKRYNIELPWYIMVSETNELDTKNFFEQNDYFTLKKSNVIFATQSMVPCLDERGKFMLESPYSIAMNPNGHGGTIQTIIEKGLMEDMENRGIKFLSYFQVDNWAVKVADPRFIGYHVLNNAEMSSKIIRKNSLREAVGVHCICDNEYRVIEYSELDIYPQLLELNPDGSIKFYAGNPAMHIITIGFVKKVYNRFKDFPWHRAHKKIPYIDDSGNLIKPEKPNGYKFETFIFDALRYTSHHPVALEIQREGEYTPIKQLTGENSIESARKSMTKMWAKWLKKSGYNMDEYIAHREHYIEITPVFALTEEEFLKKSRNFNWQIPSTSFAIDEQGNLITT
ncbi:MAG: UDPGP type 1 family protein [Candidatus Hydrogenedentes bacterium]|nr:UDPGP type 1 family protein [Candidatus Hydrogenedentota bacterium]